MNRRPNTWAAYKITDNLPNDWKRTSTRSTLDGKDSIQYDGDNALIHESRHLQVAIAMAGVILSGKRLKSGRFDLSETWRQTGPA